MPDGSWSVTEKNGLIYSFESNAGTTANTSARLLKITDRNNNALTLSYTATAACPGTYVCTVTDGPGRQLAFSYNTSGLINQIDVKGINGAIITSNDG